MGLATDALVPQRPGVRAVEKLDGSSRSYLGLSWRGRVAQSATIRNTPGLAQRTRAWRTEESEMTDKPTYRVNRRDVKITERVAMAAVGESILRSQKVHGTDTSLMFAERAPGYHTSPHRHDCEQMNYIVSGEIFFFVDGRGYRCRAGDIMRIPRNKVHWAWNRGTETAVVFESHSPPLRDRGGDAVALLGPDDDAAKIQQMSNILVKMDQAEIDRIEARGIAEEEGQQAAE
jgi:quercetin dioxygenase-like cupin family protein